MADFALPDDLLLAQLQRDRTYSAAQSAAGRGYVINAANVQHQYHAPAVPLQVGYEVNIMSNANEPFVPEEDVTHTLPDGRTIQLAAKGVPVPQAEARRLGLVKDQQRQGPKETKSQADLDAMQAEHQAEVRSLRDELARLQDERATEQARQAMRENTGDDKAEPMSVRDAKRVEADQQRRQDAEKQRQQLEKQQGGK